MKYSNCNEPWYLTWGIRDDGDIGRWYLTTDNRHTILSM